MKYCLIRFLSLLLALGLLPTLSGCSRQESEAQPPLEVPILMYHHLAEQGPYNTMTVSPESFRRDMEWLRNKGFTALNAADLELIVQGRRSLPDRPVMITFDDGYFSNYDLAFPVLRQQGLKATVAVVTCMCTDADYVSWGMSWRQLLEMQNSGLVEIGSHSCNLHDAENPTGLTPLPGESKEQFRQRVGGDLLLSKQSLEAHLGVPCRYLAYPFGKSDPWLLEWLDETGAFTVTTTTTTRVADLREGLITLPRIRMSMEEHPYDRAYLAKRSRQRLRVKAQQLTLTAGDRTRQLEGALVNGRGAVSVRALARALSGSEFGFSIGWDEKTAAMTLTPGGSYEGPVSLPRRLPHKVEPRNVTILVNGRRFACTGYEIEGSWWFRPDTLAGFLGWEPQAVTLTP